MPRIALLLCYPVMLLIAPSTFAASRTDKGATTYFKLEITGGVTAVFKACEHIGSENQVTEYISGAEAAVTHKMPGKLSVFNVVCRRAITADRSLWIWRKLVENGSVGEARKSGSLTLFDQTGAAIARWSLTKAWPSKVEVSSDDADLVVESITLAVETVDRVP